MKKFFLILLLGIAGGGVSFFQYFDHRSSQVEAHAGVARELEWLLAEFDLDEQQIEAIAGIHQGYLPVCEELCEMVIDAQGRLDKLMLTSSGLTPEIEEALNQFIEIKELCHRSMLAHVYEVAAVMSEEQRERYLAHVKSYVTMHDRPSPPATALDE